MTSNTLSAAAGILLSLVLSYTPGLAPRFDALSPSHKRLALLACLLLVAAGTLGIACSPLASALAQAQYSAPWPVECTQASAADLVAAFVSALVGSQAAYTLTPKPPE